MNASLLPSHTAPADPDLAEQAHPGHGVPSQDPNPGAQTALTPAEAEREAKSVLAGGGMVGGAALGAGIGIAVGGPVGVVVGGALGAIAGALGGAAAGATASPEAAESAGTTPADTARTFDPAAAKTRPMPPQKPSPPTRR